MDNPDSNRPGGRGQRTASAAERRQASDVSLRRIAALFTDHRRPLALVVAIIIGSSILAMATPFLLRRVVDQALPDRNTGLLAMLTLGMIAVVTVTAVLGVVQTWISTRIGQRIMHRLRSDVFAHLQRQSLGFFTATRTGEVQSRINNDIGGMQAVVTSTATSIASNLTTVVATLVAMLALSWQLTLISLVLLPISIVITRRVARMRRTITAAQQRELADMAVTIDEGLSISGVQLAKTLGTGSLLTERFSTTSERVMDLELRSQLAGRWQMATTSIIFGAVPALIYLSAALPFTSAQLSVGTLVAFAALQAGLFRPLIGLLNVSTSVISSLALFARIFEYLDLRVEVDEPAEPVDVDVDRVVGELRFDNVSYSYPGSDAAAVDGVSINVPAGSTLALVGSTGSGKTTLASLVARLHDPTSGSISIDGVDLRRYRLSDLAAIVGVVSQEAYLLHTTIRENLRYARPDATDTHIEDAARAAHIHEVIIALPDGYDTVVGSRGHRFSGGEKQRLAIARTLLRDPRILILDEATSALDTATERAVQSALTNLARGRTTIAIAHRLSTVHDADQIVVLEHGRSTERGDHETLAAADGRYAQLLAA